MKCKYCKNEIPDNSIFCNWCGEKQVRDRKKKDEVKVPKPTQLPSGKWRIQLRSEGQSITGDTADEVIIKAKAVRAGFIETKKKPDNITVAECISKYIDAHRNRLKAKSIEQYEYIRDKRFESLMSAKLCELTNDKIDRAFEQELAKPSRKGGTLSHKTVNDALNLVKSVLREYYKDLDVTVKTAEVQQSFRFLLPVEEVVEAVVGTDIELPAMLAMWLSLSASEIRGLTKSKSIRDGKLYIVETVVDVKGKAIRKAGGKEELRPRVFNIPPYIQSLIDRVDGDIIETRSAHAINQRFQKVLEQHGKQKMRFHDLRHLNASLMADKNIPTIVAQQRGGWKTDATMKKVYTHAFDQSRREADAIIDGVFEGIIGKITHENTHAEKSRSVFNRYTDFITSSSLVSSTIKNKPCSP